MLAKMSIRVFVILCLCVLLDAESLSHRPEEGYAVGYMSKCPGSTKPATIPRSQLKYLNFEVQGKGQTRRRYNYWNAKNIASDPRIDFRRRTIVASIGYLDSVNNIVASIFGNEFEARGYNVILLDYQHFTTVHYHLSSRLMRPVGKHVAEVLAQLTKSGLDPSKTELIGLSLGGHTISYIGSSYQQLTGRNLSRITGLDPAGPCFRNLPPNDRLDASNADFVQVIHTNIDGLGMAARMGHVDFYVNGGEFQPSDLTLYPCTSLCSHGISLVLWLTAMKNPNKFIAIKCDSIQEARDAACYNKDPLVTNVLGENVNVSNHGIFYLSTSKYFPFYLGKKGIKPEYASWRTITDVNDGNETEVYT